MKDEHWIWTLCKLMAVVLVIGFMVKSSCSKDSRRLERDNQVREHMMKELDKRGYLKEGVYIKPERQDKN